MKYGHIRDTEGKNNRKIAAMEASSNSLISRTEISVRLVEKKNREEARPEITWRRARYNFNSL